MEKYYNSRDVSDKVRYTSIGKRFEMWKAAWLIFQDNPSLGGGWGSYKGKVQELIDKGVVNQSIAKYYHPHNQFISALAKGGLLGFFGVSIFLLFPSIIFYKLIRNTSDPTKQRLALAGLILLIGFICFSLSESILERSRSIIFFSFYLAVFMALIRLDRGKSIRL